MKLRLLPAALLAFAGAGDAELLAMWTTNCARTLFPDRKLGALDPGFEASFLVLGADPLANFDAVRDIRMRVKEGITLEDRGTTDR